VALLLVDERLPLVQSGVDSGAGHNGDRTEER